MNLTFNLNGCEVSLDIKPNRTLLEILREEFSLTGVKKGCNQGECGACTVLVDGLPVNSCLLLAADVADKKVITIEGLARDGEIQPLQKAFIEQGAVQCGFCTPGMILSAYALLQENESPSPEDIIEAISGNICRCTGYVKIIEAINSVVKMMKAAS